MENATERLGVSPTHVTDYLALVGDTSDNVPGVKGIGEKTAQELVNSFGSVENILAHADEVTKKRPREALLAQGDLALLSKELVTIRADLPISLDLEALRVADPDYETLRTLFVELEFHTLARDVAATPPPAVEVPSRTTRYATIDTIEALEAAIARARQASHVAIDTETAIEPGAPQRIDPLRSTLIGISLAVGAAE